MQAPEDLSAHEDWVYAKLYVGAVTQALDTLVVDALPELVRAAKALDASRWFFIRYIDEDGLHLRVRVRAPHGAADRVRRALEPIALAHMARVPTLPAGHYRPAVPPPAIVAPPPGQPMRMGLVWAQYEPEVDKYGTTAVAHAEELFEVSSQIAVDILRAELTGELSRKTLIPTLMATTRDLIGSVETPAEFWRDYALFWLGGDSAQARHWRERFASKSHQLRTAGVAVSPPVSQLSATALAVVTDWERALRRARAAYDRLGTQSEAVVAKLAFHATHLMNNRLGVSMLEEAYFASLLEHAGTASEVAA